MKEFFANYQTLIGGVICMVIGLIVMHKDLTTGLGLITAGAIGVLGKDAMNRGGGK